MSRFASEGGDSPRAAASAERPTEGKRTRFTPLDIQSHHFARTFRGYDDDEVDAFLRLVAEDFERAVREGR